MSIKINRISSEVLRELSNILLVEAKNETLKQITLTGCVVTNDLGLARVYYTYMGTKTLEEVQSELDGSTSYLRTVLASRIELRHTPELKFIFDESVEYGQNIEKLINKIHKSEQ